MHSILWSFFPADRNSMFFANFGNHLPDDSMNCVCSIRYERWIDQHLDRRGHDLVQGTLPETEEDDKNDTVAVCFLSSSLVFSMPHCAGQT